VPGGEFKFSNWVIWDGAHSHSGSSSSPSQTLNTEERSKGGIGNFRFEPLNSSSGKKRAALELGANAGVVVHSDADLEYAADRCVNVGFGYSGQSCISAQRILVHQPVWETLLKKDVSGESCALECGRSHG